jgi:hypothetical protein
MRAEPNKERIGIAIDKDVMKEFRETLKRTGLERGEKIPVSFVVEELIKMFNRNYK